MNGGLRILILETIASDAELLERELQRSQIAFTARQVASRAEYLKKLLEMLPAVTLKAKFCDAFCDAAYFTRHGARARGPVRRRRRALPARRHRLFRIAAQNTFTATRALKPERSTVPTLGTMS